MGIAKILKVKIIGHSSQRANIVGKLHELGLVQVIDIEKDYQDLLAKPKISDEELEKKINLIDYAISYLSQFEKAKGMIATFLPSKIGIDKEWFQDTINNFDFQEVVDECKELESKERYIDSEIAKLKAESQEISYWQNLNISLEEIKDTKRCNTLLAVVSSLQFSKFQEALFNLSSPIFLQVVNETKRDKYIFLIFLKERREDIDEIIGRHNVNIVTLPPLLGLASQNIEDIHNKIVGLEEEKKRLFDKAKELTQNTITDCIGHKCPPTIVKLMVLYDYFSQNLNSKLIQNSFGTTLQSFMLEGWIRDEDIKILKKSLQEEFNEIEILITEPSKDEIPPIELTNKRVIEPFEFVTELYSRPLYVELDPTPFFAPFFALFFALCLTDAGYGIVLTILTYIGLKKLSLGRSGKNLFKLLFLAGIVTIIVGALAGSLFGIDFNLLPAKYKFIQNIREKIMLFDPLKNPTLFLLISLGVGVIQVLVGFMIRLYEELKTKSIAKAILSQGSWLIFIPGLILMGLVKVPNLVTLGLIKDAFLPPFFELVSKCMITGGIAGIFLFHIIRSKNIIVGFGAGLYGLYETIGYFSDVLSYIRLFALGLATCVLAVAVNTIASQFIAIPYIGFALTIIILVVGHLFNIIINALSGFIHTCRLQFVEFFTKFYEGGGKQFKPFAKETRYTVIRHQ